jgi:hypothetical protein
MPRMLRRRFWSESTLAAVSVGLCLLTLLLSDWVEIIFRVDPDAGTGAFEWMIVALTATIAATSFLLARWEWQRAVSLAELRQQPGGVPRGCHNKVPRRS